MTDQAPSIAADQIGHAEDGEWPLRPWVYAGLFGVAALLVHFVTDGYENSPQQMALAAALVFGPLALAFTLGEHRWRAPAIFAGIVALVMAGIAWRATSAGDRYSDEQFWVAAGVLAVALSVPLFQADFHRERWVTSYKLTHFHVWTDAITGAGAVAFTGLSWALLALLSELFATIRIDLLRDLIDLPWFGWVFSGVAFGAALGVLRNQLKIIGTLQNVVLLVLSILAVPLAIALVLFLLAVLVSGLDVLWEATRSATPLLLAIAVGCFVLANSVVRDDDEHASQSRLLRVAGFVLALGILPLAAMAAISMGTRIAQYGLSPERLWALVAIAVAVAYGVAYFVSAIRGWRTIMQGGWRPFLRQSNLHLAVLTCGVALLLALPIFNFGAISASNQLARLESGAVSAEEFDYSALRWDFGDAGREALAGLAKSGNAKIAKLAAEAQDEQERSYRGRDIPAQREAAAGAKIEFTDAAMAEAVRDYIGKEVYDCEATCRAIEVGEVETGPLIVLLTQYDEIFLVYDPSEKVVTRQFVQSGELKVRSAAAPGAKNREGTVELRPFSGRQLYIDGKPVGEPFK